MERWCHSPSSFECVHCATVLEDFESDVCTECKTEEARESCAGKASLKGA